MPPTQPIQELKQALRNALRQAGVEIPLPTSHPVNNWYNGGTLARRTVKASTPQIQQALAVRGWRSMEARCHTRTGRKIFKTCLLMKFPMAFDMGPLYHSGLCELHLSGWHPWWSLRLPCSFYVGLLRPSFKFGAVWSPSFRHLPNTVASALAWSGVGHLLKTQRCFASYGAERSAIPRVKKHTPLLAPRTTQFLKEWAVAAETSNCVPWIHYTARVAWIALWSANKLSHTAYCSKRLSDLSALSRAAEDESAAWFPCAIVS